MKRPVAFRVRDCADGWIIYQDEKQAYDDAEARGAQMQGLYVRDGSLWPSDWQPIETRPRDDSQFLACTDDGRVMIFNGVILDRILTNDDRAPKHLQFPATHWMPLPVPPIMAARRNGVGKAIEIVERNSKDPTKCGRCGGTGQLEYEITFHGERNQRVKDDCRYCKGTGLAA